jgi:hypothetical protein
MYLLYRRIAFLEVKGNAPILDGCLHYSHTRSKGQSHDTGLCLYVYCTHTYPYHHITSFEAFNHVLALL